MTNLDATPQDYFETQLREAIENGTIFEEGWSIQLRRYGMGHENAPALHTTLEIHGPENPDGNQFYASIDTFTYVGQNTSLLSEFMSKVNPYQTGLEMRLAVDMERETSNWVATDANLVEDYEISSGEGTQIIAEFAKLAEQAQEFNASNPNYALLSHSDNEITFSLQDGFGFEEHANSNSGPMALLGQVYGNEFAEQFGEVRDWWRSAPGTGDDISSLFAIKEPGFFQAMPEAAYAAIADPESEVFSTLTDLMKTLHPDNIAEKGPDNMQAPAVAAPLPKLEN